MANKAAGWRQAADIRLRSWPIHGFEFVDLGHQLSKEAVQVRAAAFALLHNDPNTATQADYNVDMALVAGLVADGHRVYGPDGELLGAPEGASDGATTDTTQEGATT